MSRATRVASPFPAGACLPFAGATAPTGWLLCYGQAVSRTTYATLFSAIGTAHGVGDGASTFNLPDLRGRAPIGKDDMGGAAANRVTTAVSGVNAATLGAVGGDQRAQAHSHGGAIGVGVVQLSGSASGSGGIFVVQSDGVNATIGTTHAGTSQNLPPAIVMNVIIKI